MHTGMLRAGRLRLHFDTRHLRRTATDGSTVYSLLGFVVRWHPAEGHAAKVAGAKRARLIRKWQRELIKLWRFTEWQTPLRPGEPLPDWYRRRWDHCVRHYEARAAFDRALDPDVPAVDQLVRWAPKTFPIPASAHSG